MMQNNKIEKINSDLEREQNKLQMLQNKRTEIEGKIEAVENKIKVLKANEKEEKLKYLAEIALSNGTSIDDLIKAVQSNNLSAVASSSISQPEDNINSDNNDY